MLQKCYLQQMLWFWEHWISYFPNLVCRGSFVFWIDSERFLSQKFSDCCKIPQTSISCSKCYNLWQPPDNFFLYLLQMKNHYWVPNLKVIYASVSKLYHLLQIKLFCSILQQPDIFSKKRPVWIYFTWTSIPMYQV